MSELSQAIDKLLLEAISDGAFPGAAYAIHKHGKTIFGAVGHQTYCPDSPTISLDSIWDLASVSKVIGTTSAAILMVQEHRLDLDSPVSSVLPEFGENGKEKITFRNLLVHDSGLIAFRPYHKTFSDPSKVLQAIYKEKLNYPTGSKSVYSDLNMIVLAKAIEKLTVVPLERFLRDQVFASLGMGMTGYFGDFYLMDHALSGSFIETIDRNVVVPTERTEEWRTNLRRIRWGDLGSAKHYGYDPAYIQCEVHDPTATVLGGVAGHAGLFSTVGDIACYLDSFTSKTPKLFDPKIRDLFTTKQSDLSSRALGWDTKSPTGSSAGSKMSSNAYGHTGYTGTSVWVDPTEGSFFVLLTNRVHPTSDNPKISALRPRFHDVSNSIL